MKAEKTVKIKFLYWEILMRVHVTYKHCFSDEISNVEHEHLNMPPSQLSRLSVLLVDNTKILR